MSHPSLPQGWEVTSSSGASLEGVDGHWVLGLKPGEKDYHNAQLDDYRNLKRTDFQNGEGLSLEAEIKWNQNEPLGTSGIGFWNDPFMMTGWRWPSLPKVAWFLMSGPDSHMKVGRAPGRGLKAQVIDAWSLRFFFSIPLLILAPILGRFFFPSFFMERFSKAIGLSEQVLTEKTGHWRHFRIDWKKEGVDFYVDGDHVLSHQSPLKGSMGLVIWQDNQWMFFDPIRGFRWGTSVLAKAQCMELRNLHLRK